MKYVSSELTILEEGKGKREIMCVCVCVDGGIYACIHNTFCDSCLL